MTCNVLAIDVSLSGISGDMFLAALIDLNDKLYTRTDTLKLIDSFSMLLSSKINMDIDIALNKIDINGFEGLKLDLRGFDAKIDIPDIEELIDYLLEENSIANKYAIIAKSVFSIMLEAEKLVHKTDHLHLHELGSVDTVLDIVLATILMSKLNICGVIVSPVALGQGVVDTAHGKLPVPAPATLEIMQLYHIDTVPGPRGGEATTPTGMAILAALINHLPTISNAVFVNHGRGYGTKKWSDRKNYLRLRLGKNSGTASKVNVLETNIDDVSAEILGYAVELLMSKGALDVSYYPIFMKKNRPAYCLRVIVKKDDTDFIADEIQKLTGTLGIRVFEIQRHIGERSIEEKSITIEGKEVSYRLKKGKYRSKIEFEDLKHISEKYDIPIFQLKKLLDQEE